MKFENQLAKALGSLAIALVVVLTSGCAASHRQAAAGVGGQRGPAPGLDHASHQGWSAARGSLVSPFGDAPGERDLELTRTGGTLQSGSGHACADCAADATRIAASR